MKIKNLFIIKTPNTTSRKYLNDTDGVFCVHYGDIYKNYSNKFIKSSKIINKFNFKIDKTKYIFEDSIILPDVTETISDFGHLTYIINDNNNYINGTHTFAICSKNNNNLKYLFYYLQSKANKKRLQSLLLGSTVFQLSLKDFNNFELKEYHSSDIQQHIVDIIGSIDDKIENNENLILKYYDFLILNMKKLSINKTKSCIFNFEYISILKSGINKFNDEKIYIDTSCVTQNFINDISNKIKYNKRPSRANMQPEINTVWFAKLKNSPKHIIIKEYSDYILNNMIFSTGFFGLKINKVKFNLLATYFISNEFDNNKNLISVGATMQSINNEDLLNMKIPNFTDNDFINFNKTSEPLFKQIEYLKIENIKLKRLKKMYLKKFFG